MSAKNETSKRVVVPESDSEYPFASKVIDWDEYLAYRPVYPSSMWETWLEYHGNHGGGFRVAHDIGAGKSPWSG